MSTTTSGHGKPRRSLWRRLVDLFRGNRSGSGPIPNEEVFYQPTDDTALVKALCHGDVFEFQVNTALVWSSRQMSYRDLVNEAREFTASAQDTVRERIWQVARGYSPYQSEAAEKAIQEVLDERWCYQGSAGTVQCSAKAWVQPDPKVREHLTPFAVRELELEANTALAMLRADRFEQVALRWQALFDKLGHDAMVAYASQLTDPAIAGVVTSLVNHRRASAVELADVLRQASKDHEHVGLYEFASAYDAALQNLRRQMHLDENGFPVVVADSKADS